MLRDNGPLSVGGRLTPCSDAAEAAWIGPRLMSFASGVGALVPPVFEAHARIFHAAGRGYGGLVRWAEVAAWSGGTVHALAQFHDMARPRGPDLPAGLAGATVAALPALQNQDPEPAHMPRVEHADDAGAGAGVVGEGQARAGLQRSQLLLEACGDEELRLRGR